MGLVTTFAGRIGAEAEGVDGVGGGSFITTLPRNGCRRPKLE